MKIQNGAVISEKFVIPKYADRPFNLERKMKTIVYVFRNQGNYGSILVGAFSAGDMWLAMA